MARIFNMKELKIVAKRERGLLARITELIAKAHVNIGAFFTYTMGEKAEFYFITANNERVKILLRDAGFKTTERDVIVVEVTNEYGILFNTAKHLAETGVDLDYAYSTAGNMGTSWMIFATKTNVKPSDVES